MGAGWPWLVRYPLFLLPPLGLLDLNRALQLVTLYHFITWVSQYACGAFSHYTKGWTRLSEQLFRHRHLISVIGE
jgi:hypothetical protein